MAIFGCNLKETQLFIEKTNQFREKLKKNRECPDLYPHIKEFLQEYMSFLRYTKTINVKRFYRVRKVKDNPFRYRKDLIYPKPSPNQKNRMNNALLPVLYASFHEFTAITEANINIDQKFQLTRFSTDKKLTVFQLGKFSELYLNSPRDSEYVKSEMKNIFDSDGHDSTIRGYAALECAMANILYDKNCILSPDVALTIFNNKDSGINIDAILYPSTKNRYGVNLAIKQELADTIPIEYTTLNILDEIYDNGFYKYLTLQECCDLNNEPFVFKEIEGRCTYR